MTDHTPQPGDADPAWVHDPDASPLHVLIALAFARAQNVPDARRHFEKLARDAGLQPDQLEVLDDVERLFARLAPRTATPPPVQRPPGAVTSSHRFRAPVQYYATAPAPAPATSPVTDPPAEMQPVEREAPPNEPAAEAPPPAVAAAAAVGATESADDEDWELSADWVAAHSQATIADTDSGAFETPDPGPFPAAAAAAAASLADSAPVAVTSSTVAQASIDTPPAVSSPRGESLYAVPDSQIAPPFTPSELALDDGNPEVQELRAAAAAAAARKATTQHRNRNAPLPRTLQASEAGPFRIDRRFEGRGSSGHYGVTDMASGRKLMIRVLSSSALRGETFGAVLGRLEAALSVQPPPVLVPTLGALRLVVHRDGPHDIPVQLERADKDPNARLGLLEPERTGRATFNWWLGQNPTWEHRVSFLRSVLDALLFLENAKLPHGRLTSAVIGCTEHHEPRIDDWVHAAVIPVDHTEPHGRVGEGLPDSSWFIAPEVFLSTAVTTSRSDQYSFGVLLYRVLSGELPPEWRKAAKSLMKGIQAMERGIVTLPSDLNEALDDSLDRVIMRAAAVDPARRFGSFTELRDALNEALSVMLAPEDGPITGEFRMAEREMAMLGARGASSRYPLVTHTTPPPMRMPSQYEKLEVVKEREGTHILRVRHRETAGEFALKLFCIPDMKGEQIRRQAENEYAALLHCQGEGIVALQDYGRYGDREQYQFIALEWAGGWQAMPETRSQVLEDDLFDTDDSVDREPAAAEADAVIRSLRDLVVPVPEDVAVWIATQALRALHHCHSRTVVHYDIKPGNFLCFANGVIKLADFGVANYQRAYGHPKPGEIFGSPAYLSPEQVNRVPEPDPRSDLFSFGVMLYELLTGQRPNPYLPANEHGHTLPDFQPPQDPTPLTPWGLSPAIATLVTDLLQPDPQERMASAAEAFERLKHSPVHPVSWSRVHPVLRRRHTTEPNALPN